MDQAAPTPLPDLVLWRGDGCHLCDEGRELVKALLAERAAAGGRVLALVERRIADDPAVERELFEQVPVLEHGGRRLPLAIRAGAVRAFLASILDAPAVSADAATVLPAGTVLDAGAAADADALGDVRMRAGGLAPHACGSS